MSQTVLQQHISGAAPKPTDSTAISLIAIDVLSVRKEGWHALRLS